MEFEGKVGETNDVRPQRGDILSIRECRECHFSLSSPVTKVVIEKVQNTTVHINASILTGMCQILSCEDTTVVFTQTASTITVDKSTNCTIDFRVSENHNQFIWSQCSGLKFKINNQEHAIPAADVLKAEADPESALFRSRWVGGSVVSELVSSEEVGILQQQIGQYVLDSNTILGEGLNSKVVLGTDARNGTRVAVKMIEQQALSERARRMVDQEIRTLRRLPPHPHIIRLLDVLNEGGVLYVVNEFIEEGDLFEYMLHHPSDLTDRAIKHFFSQVVKAVHFLHKHGIVHHDIKLENVGLRKGSTSTVLMDFGYSCEYSDDRLLSRFCGTLCYCAPELLLGKPYSATPIDVWSLGVLLYVLICKRFPFDTDNPDTLYKQASSRNYIHSILQSTQISEDAQDLLQKIFIPTSYKRISVPDILRHRFLKGADDGLSTSSGITAN